MKVVFSEDEQFHIDAFIQSPIYTTICKIVNSQREVVSSRIMSERDPVEIYRLQGECAGLNEIVNLPKLLAAQFAKQKATAKKVQAFKAARKIN